ncbi:MAG: flagellar FlaF family protein [Rhodospirillaceae bacterium]|nr:flagellar FlaF family protein [Rhodospirillaceae bacterium]
MSGIDAYKKALNKTASSRNAEYRLLAQVTAALIEAKEADGDMRKNPAKMKMLAHALNWNNEVWSTFMDDCRSEDNKLPEKLRGGILSLGIWVNKETQAALNGDVGLDALISVNRDIMKGLDDATTVKTDSEK